MVVCLHQIGFEKLPYIQCVPEIDAKQKPMITANREELEQRCF